MKLQETKPGTNSSGKNIHDVLGEEVNASTVQETTSVKNDDDFMLDGNEPEPEARKAAPTLPEPELKEDTKKITEKSEVIAPDGTKSIQTTVTETTELNEVKARSVKPNMMLLMWDMFVPKLGSAIYPDTDANHWKIPAADKGDLTILISESAKEGDWKGVPTKIFLIIALAAIILVKWRSRNDNKINTSENKQSTVKTLEQTKIELQAKEETKAMFAKYEDELAKMQKQNKILYSQIEKLTGKKNTYYEEVTEEDIKAGEKIVQAAKTIIQEAQYKGFDLDKIRFSLNGGFVEREKAGTKGYNAKGVKIGVPSAEHKDLFDKWKRYHSGKETDIPYFVA